MIRVVVDANILVSGFAAAGNPRSLPAEVVHRWQARAFQLVISDHVLREVERAFVKRYFRRRMRPDDISEALLLLAEDSQPVELTRQVVGVASHASDDPILETADVGGARYLVTGDHALLALGRYRDVLIVTPEEFLAVLDAAEGDASGAPV